MESMRFVVVCLKSLRKMKISTLCSKRFNCIATVFVVFFYLRNQYAILLTCGSLVFPPTAADHHNFMNNMTYPDSGGIDQSSNQFRLLLNPRKARVPADTAAT